MTDRKRPPVVVWIIPLGTAFAGFYRVTQSPSFEGAVVPALRRGERAGEGREVYTFRNQGVQTRKARLNLDQSKKQA